MSDSNTADRRGQSAGSRRNRFSADNQPTRRRQRARSPDLAGGMLEALKRPITVTVGGKKKTMEVQQAFTQSISQELLKAPLSEKRKFLSTLQKLGVADLLAAQSKLGDERLEFEGEKREFERSKRQLAMLSNAHQREAHEHKLRWYGAADLTLKIAQICTCGAASSTYAEPIRELAEILKDNKEVEASVKRAIDELREMCSQTLANDDHDSCDSSCDDDWEDDPNDEFYTGEFDGSSANDDQGGA